MTQGRTVKSWTKRSIISMAALLAVTLVVLANGPAKADSPVRFEAEGMTFHEKVAKIHQDARASGNRTLRYTSDRRRAPNTTITLPETAKKLIVYARAGHRRGTPAIQARVDGSNYGTRVPVGARFDGPYLAYEISGGTIPVGSRNIAIKPIEVGRGHNLYVDHVEVVVASAADPDDDGIPDPTDNCPGVANDDQSDNDGDAQGDACDADDDNDGRSDAEDDAPLDPEVQDRAWDCTGKQIYPGDDLDAVVNSDPASRATTFCVHGGTYPLSSTLVLRSGDTLEGEEGSVSTLGPASFPTAPPVKITNGADLTRIIALDGNGITVRWVDVSGAKTLRTAKGGPQNGTGIGIAAGEGGDTSTIEWVRVHDNGNNGIGNPRGRVLHVEGFRNTLDPVFLGHSGASIKGTAEYEVAYSYFHDEQGNGPWCDQGCQNNPDQPNGFWVHHNVLADNDRYGARYEYSAMVPKGVHIPADPKTNQNALMEDNLVAENGFGGLAVQAAQNAVVRDNVIGKQTVEGRTFGNNGSGSKAIQATDSAKSTDLWNVDVYGNSLRGGEFIQGCNRSAEVVSCSNND